MLILVACFLLTCYWSIRFSLADSFYRVNTLDAVRRAVDLVPGNASYRSLLAEHIGGVGLNPDNEMVKAAGLSPLESRYWIRLGFRREVEGNFGEAEKYLLQAARWTISSLPDGR